MPRYVAFLRAINTPPRHVKMARLSEIVSGLGLQEVVTYIASGNVVFATPDDDGLIARLEEGLAAGLGFEVPVFLRTGDEVIEVAERRPFGENEENHEISFLPETPDPSRVSELLDGVTGSDRLAVVGREVHWMHPGPRSESQHREGRVMRVLGMPTTQRSAGTVRAIADRFLR